MLLMLVIVVSLLIPENTATDSLTIKGSSEVRFQDTIFLRCTTSDRTSLPLTWFVHHDSSDVIRVQPDGGRWMYRTTITNSSTTDQQDGYTATSELTIAYSSIFDQAVYECRSGGGIAVYQAILVTYDPCRNGSVDASIYIPQKGCVIINECDGVESLTISSWRDQLVAHDIIQQYKDTFGMFHIGEQHFEINLHNEERTFQWHDFIRDNDKRLTFTAWNDYYFGDEYSTCVSISSRSDPDKPFESWIFSRCSMRYDICMILDTQEKTVHQPTNIPPAVGVTMKNTSLSVRERLFRCEGTGEFILSYFVCDQTPDCSDKSDESLSCENTKLDDVERSKFRCDLGKYISLNLVCDFYEDCKDGADERNCFTPDCLAGQWTCHSGQCIPDYDVCDSEPECADESDESTSTCSGYSGIETLWKCQDKNHVPINRACDGIPDCYDNSDEYNCSLGNPTYSCTTHCQVYCPPSLIRVHLGSHGHEHVRCTYDAGGIHMTWPFSVFMGEFTTRPECEFVNIPEGSIIIKLIDDQPIPVRYKSEHLLDILLSSSIGCHQTVQLCYPAFEYQRPDFEISSERNGKNMGDLMYCGNAKPDCDPYHGCYMMSPILHEDCMDKTTVVHGSDVPIRWVRLKKNDNSRPILLISPLVCTEDSDVIEPKYLESQLLCQNGFSYYPHQRCLMDFEPTGEPSGCRDLTHIQNCEHFTCPENYQKCHDSYCLHVRFLCDGIPHCPNSEDEVGCDDYKCPGYFKCHRSRMCIPLDQICDGIRHCPYADDERHCEVTCPEGCTCDGLIFECLGEDLQLLVGDIGDMVRGLTLRRNLSDWTGHLPMDFYAISSLIMRHCQIQSLTFQNESVLSGVDSLITLDLSYNSIISIGSDTFSMLSRLKYLIIHGNPIIYVDNGGFAGLHSLMQLYLTSTRINKLSAGMFDNCESLTYLNLSSNDISLIENNAFSSLSYTKTLDLRNNRLSHSEHLFRGLTSLRSLYVDAYNLCCAKPSSVTDPNCFAPKDSISSCNDLIRLNILRILLWIIGLCAVLGNLFVMAYRFKYDRANLKKSYSIFVINLSISDILMGIYILIIGVADAMYRGRYVWEEDAWRHSFVCTLSGILSTVSSEASAFVILFITLDRTVAIVFPFSRRQFTMKTAILSSVIIWTVAIVIAILPVACCGDYFQGEFYSSSGVCLALPLSDSSSPGSEYSVAVFVGLNFIIFIVIAFCQVVIYRESRTHRSLKKMSNKQHTDIAVARALTAVVATDFCCWFPIGVLGIWTAMGGSISGDVYAWIMVLVLPINSALNPFLYTFANTLKKRKTRNSRYSQSSNSFYGRKTEIEMTNVVLDVLKTYRQNRCSRSLTDHLSRPDTEVFVRDAFTIIQQVSKHLTYLHDQDLVHGSISQSSIQVVLKNGRVVDATFSMDHSCVRHDYEQFNDVHDLGMLTKLLLRKIKKP